MGNKKTKRSRRKQRDRNILAAYRREVDLRTRRVQSKKKYSRKTKLKGKNHED